MLEDIHRGGDRDCDWGETAQDGRPGGGHLGRRACRNAEDIESWRPSDHAHGHTAIGRDTETADGVDAEILGIGDSGHAR